LLGLIGTEEGGPVIPLNIIADYAAGGLQVALAVLFALFAREKTG
jgi:alpha-methylacyl-CoA racemase